MSAQIRKDTNYFLCHLPPGDRAPNYLRSELLPEFSIQRATKSGGLSGKCAYIDKEDESACIDGEKVPDAVITAVKNLEEGNAGWFNERGEPIGFS